MERRLAAILAADVVGYSRLMEADEAGALETLNHRRAAVIDPAIAGHGGRIVKLMGDGVLAEFPSIVEAVEAAMSIQRGMEEANGAAPGGAAMRLRIGVNLGDVMAEDGDIYGTGVNVAARLEKLAPPGGVCVSDLVRQSAEGRLAVHFEDLGRKRVKNIAEPIRVFAVREGSGAAPAPSEARPGRRVVLFAALVVCLGAAALGGWMLLAGGESAGETCVDHLGLPVDAANCPKPE